MLLCPGSFPGKSTGVGYHFLLQGIFPTQGSTQGLLHWQMVSLLLSHLESPHFIVIKFIWPSSLPYQSFSKVGKDVFLILVPPGAQCLAQGGTQQMFS